MKIIAINGSPRKNWNTARLLEAALGGARAQGAETKLYQRKPSCIICMIMILKDVGAALPANGSARLFTASARKKTVSAIF